MSPVDQLVAKLDDALSRASEGVVRVHAHYWGITANWLTTGRVEVLTHPWRALRMHADGERDVERIIARCRW